jgi:hypothetical protein
MKNEIIEEAKKVYQKALQNSIELSFYDGVNLGAELQAKIMYSEKKMLELLYERPNFNNMTTTQKQEETKSWFEQNKKK